MKQRSFLLIVVFWTITLPAVFSQVNPGAVAGAKLWLKANAGVEVVNGNRVVRWNNQSSSGDIQMEADTVSENLDHILLGSNVINFNNALLFDGQDTAYLRGLASTGFNTTSTLFVVCRLNSLPNPSGETLIGVLTSRNTANSGGGQGISVGGSTTSPYFLIDADGAQSGHTAVANTSSNKLALISGIYNDPTSTLNSIINTNGLLSQTYTGSDPRFVTPECRVFEVGGRSFSFQQDRAFFGEIAELIYYPAILNNADIKNVESYLAVKYGITLGIPASPVNYTASNGSMIWQAHSTYQNSIFGIGKDNASGLLVTQSNSMNHGSGDGTGDPGAGNIVLRNASSLDDLDFLLIGNTSTFLIPENSLLPADPIFAGKLRLGEQWKVQHTGNVGTVDLSFDINNVPLSGDPSNVALLISEGDDNFTTGTYRFYNTPILNGNILTYSAITLNNNDYFTFVTNLTDPLSQTGDYRSKATGIWNNITSWETFDGTNWIDATLVPNGMNSNLITIRSGHNITQDLVDQPMDQLVVDNGGILTITATTRPANGPGTDIIINPTGAINMTAGSITGSTMSITNTGTVTMAAGALFAANFTNSGTLSLTTTGSKTFGIPQFINNGNINWNTGGTLSFGTGNLVNNANITMNFNGTRGITGAGSSITNSASGIITSNQVSTITIAPSLVNEGTIKGIGIFDVNGPFTNHGVVSPGLSPGILGIEGNYGEGTLAIELVDASGAGIGHDQLSVTGPANLSNVTLNITDAGIPAGDYIILTASGGVTGNFLNVASLPPNYTVVVNSNNIVLRVNFPLPLTWVSFSGKYLNNKIILDWTTASENNTSHFVIERSNDGIVFNSIGQISASGNTSFNTFYQFTDASPLINDLNFYRIKQVDIDGRISYSSIIRISTNNENIFKTRIVPNPALSVINLLIEGIREREVLSFELMNTNGMLIYKEQIITNGSSMIKTIPRPAIGAGLYFYKIIRTINNETFSGQLLLR